MTELNTNHLAELARNINEWAQELGFNGVGISDSGLEDAGDRLNAWLAKGWHGEMSFMSRNTEKRIKPELLIPEVKRIISVRLNYWPEQSTDPGELIKQQDQAYIARYALGRDYHRLMRRRLQQLANRISDEIGPFHYRAFVDSAPVMEKPLASAAGLGWIGKHTNLIDPHSGSWFFLGELYTDLPLPTTRPAKDHCGSCRGAGVNEEIKSLSVSIPAGVDNGDKVRLSGEGSAARGGPAGDLYVAIQVIANNIFERDGRDLYFEAPIPFEIAILGGSINIPGIESKIVLKIPAYTQTGKIFRIKGKGASSVRDSRRGDLMCRVVVETPVNLSNAQLKTFKEFAASIESEKHHPIKDSFNKSADQFLKE